MFDTVEDVYKRIFRAYPGRVITVDSPLALRVLDQERHNWGPYTLNVSRNTGALNVLVANALQDNGYKNAITVNGKRQFLPSFRGFDGNVVNCLYYNGPHNEGALWDDYMYVFPFVDLCVLVPYPVYIADSLTSKNGEPVVCWPEMHIWAYRERHVPLNLRWALENPDQIGLDTIHRNQTHAPILIELYGIARYTCDTGTFVDSWRDSRFYRNNRYKTAALRVVCPSTGEVDYLAVPFNMPSCLEALAWTVGLTGKEYKKIQES